MKAPVFAGLLAACLLVWPTAAFAENYPQFRGASADAVSQSPLPVTWSDADGKQTNIRWKLPLEGEGWSQPIVWGDRLFMTAAVPADKAAEDATKPESNNGGYGRNRDDLVNVVYEYRVICLNTQNGEQVWNTTVRRGRPPLPRHSTNTYATETPVTDGRHIYAYFGMNGLYCLDMDGSLVWQRDLGVYEMRAGWGTASSPTLLDDRLFLQIDNQQQSFLVAIDTATGEDVWRVNRDESSQYSTPFLWKNSLRTELIVGGMVYRSHDPATGKLLWQIDMNKGRSSATPVAIGDRLFVGNEFRNRGGDDDGGGRLYAIIPGGSGDITPPGNRMSGEFVQWRMDDSGIQMASPTFCGGNLYFFERRRGIVNCVDVETGRLEYSSRVRGADAFWASPWTDGRHLYVLDSNANTHVLAPSDKGLEVVAVNTLEQQAWGTPAIADGCIFLRTVDNLYCIAETPQADAAAARDPIRFETRQLSAEASDVSQPRRRRPMANGLPPQEAAEAMTVPPGFTVTNLAAEPDVRQPIAMAFDHRGRLWVAEAYSYPVRLPDEEARDRILIFEDTDGDDVFDRRTVFIEGLNLVSGLEVGFGGVWVGAAPYLMFIPDADGDDVPDGEPEILLDGWAWQDTHETLNAFTWGPDGWLYGCHGVFTHSNVGKPGAGDADRTRLNAAIWRYHPTKHEFEVFAEGTSNPWGVDFNDVGDAFETACVIPHLYHMIQNGRYQRQAGQHFNPWTYDDIKTIARHRHWTGGQWNQADREKSDAIGGGHAHSGAMVYLGGAWPERYRGKLLMNNIHGARLNMDRLEPAGSGYIGDGEPDFLFANDSWSQIIALQYGPDGQVTFIDWYDANQCHHNEFEKHDRENGRIFKVSYIGTDGGEISGPADVAALTDAQLVDLLAHTNDWYVRHARRVLQERAIAGSLESGTTRLLAERLAAAPTPEKRLRILWAMHVTGSLEEATLLQLLDDASPHVRGWAVQLACEDLSVDGEAHLARELMQACETLAAADPSPVVRRFLASAAGRMPLADRWGIVTRLVAHEEDASDHNLPLLEWYAIEPLMEADPSRALELVASSRIPTVARFLVRRAAAEEAFVDPLILAMAKAGSQDRAWMLAEVIAALEARGRASMPHAWEAGYETLRQDEDELVRRLADDIAARFGDPRVRPLLRARLVDASLPLEQRIAAIDALVASRDVELAPVLHRLLAADQLEPHAGILTKLLSALAAIPHEATPEAIVEVYGRLPSEVRQSAIAALTARPTWTLALLSAIEEGRVPRSDLTAFTVGRLAESADEAVLTRLKDVWGTIRPPSADRQAAFAAWRETLTKEALADADLSHGREIFAKTCGSCHKLHGIGADIGPELTGSNRRDLEYLLANLLDPSALVGRDYQMTQVVTTDGRVIGGIVVAETPTSIALQTPTERVVVPLEEIDVRELSTQSLMPENQLAQMPPASAVALVAYLQHPAQVPLPGEGPPPFNAEGRIAGAIEGEALKVHGTAAGRVAPQAMGNFKAGRWSGSSHLWWTDGKPGDAITLDVPIERNGTFEAFAILTKAPDYATVSVRFHDGRPVGPIDLYDPQVIPMEPISLGCFDLEPGNSLLQIEIIGTNNKAVPAYMVGLDCLYLVPVEDPPLAAATDSGS